MRYISCKLEDLKKIVLPIGYEGENDHTRVQVDAGEVFKEYPAAVPSLKVHGPTGAIYPAEVTRDGKNVIWDIKASDCAADGSGEAQFTFTLNNVIVKSCIAKIKVYRSSQRSRSIGPLSAAVLLQILSRTGLMTLKKCWMTWQRWIISQRPRRTGTSGRH